VDNTFKKTVIGSVAFGTAISLTLFLVSWWTHSFDFLVYPQFPGFYVSSLLWGFPGFPHHPSPGRGEFLFPFVMVGVNTVFYGALIYLCLIIGKQWARR
jgi:hypothetical protein